MGKQQGQPSFGATLQEVDSSISAMNAEREAIAAKQGTKEFDNKRFEELSNNLVVANKHRASLVPQENGVGNQTFTQQTTTVPPAQLGQPSTTETVFGAPAANPLDQIQSTDSLLGSVSPEQEVLGGQNLSSPNNINLINTQPQQVGEVQVPESGSRGIVNNLLSNIDRTKSDGIGNQITKAMFGQPNTSFKQQPMVDITPSDLFFAAGEPLQKGSYSGQLIGNNPNYVGGADYFPTHLLAKRQKAIQDAAIEQKKAEQDFLSQRAPLIQDKGFQQSLNQTFNDNFNTMVDQAKETYGENWLSAIKDQSTDIGRQFVNFSDNMNYLAGASDQTTELIASTRTNMDEGNLVYSPETMQMVDDYENLQGQFAGGDINSSVNLRAEAGKMQGFIGLDTFLNDKDVNVEATVTGFGRIVDNNDSYITEESKKTAYEGQLRQLANDWATGKVPSELSPLVRSGLITEDDIFNHLQSLYGYDAVVGTKSVSNKPAGSGGITINMNQDGTETTDKTETFGGVAYETGVSYEISTNGKPMDMSGVWSLDANGNRVAEEGISNIDPNAVQAVKVGVKQADGTVKYEWGTYIAGKQTNTVYIDKNGKQTTDKTKAVKSREVTTDKLYVWDDNTKKRMMADNPNQADNIELMDEGVKADVEARNGERSVYDEVDEITSGN